jgi:hypothetical protein
MKYRFVLIAGALFALACQALFGNLSVPNGRYCNVGDGTCGAGQVCDPTLHACVDVTANGDGGAGADGGITTTLDFFAAPITQVQLSVNNMPLQKGVPYKANLDNVAPADVFIMGSGSYTKVTNAGPNAVIQTVNYQVSGEPQMAAVGRLDDDAFDDVVLIFPMAKRVEIISSKVASPIVSTLSSEPRAVAVGDYDGDGDNDIAIGDKNGAVAFFLGNGSGNFPVDPGAATGSITDYSVAAMVTVPDLDGDKDAELAFSLVHSSASPVHRVRLLLGDSNLSAVSHVEADLSGLPSDLVVGNFSGSSRDLAVLVNGMAIQVFTDLALSRLTLPSELGLGSYRTSVTMLVGGRMVVGRFFPDAPDRNTIDDLAVLLSDGSVVLYQGKLDHRMRPPPVVNKRALAAERMVAGDFIVDQTGRDDLVGYSDRGTGTTVATLTLVRSNVGGSLGDLVMAQQHPVGSSLAASTPMVFAGKFTDAQKEDMVLVGAGPAGQAQRCVLDAQNNLSCGAPHSLGFAAGTGATITCGDQKARLLLGGSASLVMLDFTSGSASQSGIVSLPAGVKQVEVADINKDGTSDIVVLDGSDTVNIYAGVPGNQNCTFDVTSPTSVNPSGSGFELMALGDVNSDGYPDLVIGGATKLSLYLNSKDKRFAVSSAAGVHNYMENLQGLAIADFRGMRKAEIAVMTSAAGGLKSSLTLLIPDVPGGSLVPVGNTAVLPLPYRRMVHGDLNGDGAAELVLLSKARGLVSTAASFGKDLVTYKHYAIGHGPEWVAIGQVDSDPGSPRDIIAINGAPSGAVGSALWILQGILPGQLVQ